MTEDATLSPEEVKHIAQRVLAIERVTLRRAWGLAYGVAAAELLLRLFLPVAGYSLGLSAVTSVLGNLVLQTVVALLGFAVSIWIFRRVYALGFVRRTVFSSFWTRPLPQLVALALVIFALAYAGLISALLFLRLDFATILFGLAAANTPWFYYSLKVSFPEGIPREGMASLLAYGVASIGTTIVTMSVLAGNVIPYLSLWGMAVLVFLLAFIHSRSVRLPEPPTEIS